MVSGEEFPAPPWAGKNLIFEDLNYISMIKEKLTEIKHFSLV